MGRKSESPGCISVLNAAETSSCLSLKSRMAIGVSFLFPSSSLCFSLQIFFSSFPFPPDSCSSQRYLFLKDSAGWMSKDESYNSVKPQMCCNVASASMDYVQRYFHFNPSNAPIRIIMSTYFRQDPSCLVNDRVRI